MTGTWWGDLLLGIAVGVAFTWLVLVVALVLLRPSKGLLREAVRLLPDLLRLLRRLAADPTLPRGVRIRLALLLAYLAMPIDLVPDFIPVVGLVDQAVADTLRRAGGHDQATEAEWVGQYRQCARTAELV